MLTLVAAVFYAAVATARVARVQRVPLGALPAQRAALGDMIFALAMHGTLLTISRDMRTPSEAAANDMCSYTRLG